MNTGQNGGGTTIWTSAVAWTALVRGEGFQLFGQNGFWLNLVGVSEESRPFRPLPYGRGSDVQTPRCGVARLGSGEMGAGLGTTKHAEAANKDELPAFEIGSTLGMAL